MMAMSAHQQEREANEAQMMASVVETKSRFNELMGLLHRLNRELIIVKAYGYEIPDQLKPAEMIEVTSTTGKVAEDWVRQAFISVYRDDNQNPNYSRRFPGIVVVKELPLKTLLEINMAKDALAGILSSMQGSLRSRFMRQALPNVSSFQLTRHIPYQVSAPRIASFTWANNTPSVKRLSIDEAANMLLNHTGLPSLAPQDLARLSAVTGQLVERRTMAPHPRLNITLKDGTRLMKPAALPMILVHDPEHPTTIHPLVGFDPDNYRAKRNDAQDYLPVFEGLHIYEQNA